MLIIVDWAIEFGVIWGGISGVGPCQWLWPQCRFSIAKEKNSIVTPFLKWNGLFVHRLSIVPSTPDGENESLDATLNSFRIGMHWTLLAVSSWRCLAAISRMLAEMRRYRCTKQLVRASELARKVKRLRPREQVALPCNAYHTQTPVRKRKNMQTSCCNSTQCYKLHNIDIIIDGILRLKSRLVISSHRFGCVLPLLVLGAWVRLVVAVRSMCISLFK